MMAGLLYSRSREALPHRLYQQKQSGSIRRPRQAKKKTQEPEAQGWQTPCPAAQKVAAHQIKLLGLFV